jgi:hypothetical protein
MADDEIVVEIEKEEPEKKPGEQTTDPSEALKQQLTELQAETAREKADRLAAQQQAVAATQRAAAAQAEVETTRTEIAETRLGTVEQGIAAAQTEADAAAAESQAALETGDWKKHTEAQRKMMRAEATKVRLEEAKSDLEVQKAQPGRQQQRTEAPQTQADPVEAFIQSRDAGTQAWLRSHPDDARVLATNSDPRRAAKLNAADADAYAEGFERGSKQYFEHVEKFLGVTKPNGKTATNGTAQTQRRAASAPVAPVAASAGGVSGGTEVRLSPGEAASATDGTLTWNYDDPTGQKRFKKGDPIGVQEFARRKLALKQSGQYDKSLTEQ